MSRIEELFAESGLELDDSAELAELLAPLEDLPEAPAPSAALTALFEGRPVPVDGTYGPRKRAVAGVLVLALSGVGATGLSAAANTLPRPLQHHVSEFSRHYLPFDLPEPPARQSRSAPQPAHVLPDERGSVPGDEASRSVDGRLGAGAPDSSVDRGPASSQDTGPATTATPGTPAAPSASPAPSSLSPSTSKPSSTPSPSSTESPSASPVSGDDHKDRGKDGKDRGKKPQDPGKKPAPGSGDKPPAPGGGKPAPEPAPAPDPGDGGSAPDPTPALPPLLPDLPPVVDLPGATDAAAD